MKKRGPSVSRTSRARPLLQVHSMEVFTHEPCGLCHQSPLSPLDTSILHIVGIPSLVAFDTFVEPDWAPSENEKAAAREGNGFPLSFVCVLKLTWSYLHNFSGFPQVQHGSTALRHLREKPPVLLFSCICLPPGRPCTPHARQMYSIVLVVSRPVHPSDDFPTHPAFHLLYSERKLSFLQNDL